MASNYTISSFDKGDWEAFNGCEAFADGKQPLVCYLDLRGGWQGYAVADAEGIEVSLDELNEEERSVNIVRRAKFESASVARAALNGVVTALTLGGVSRGVQALEALGLEVVRMDW